MPTPPPSTVVGVLAEPGAGALIGMLAAAAAGAAFLPLDPKLPDARLDFMVDDCRVRKVVADAANLERAQGLAARAGATVRVLPLGTAPAAGPCPAGTGGCPAPPPQAHPDEVTYVIYTSGSTGRPKGVAVTHGNLAPLLRWSRDHFGLGPGTRVIQNLSPAFDFGTWEMLTTVCTGGTLLFPGRPGDRTLSAFAEAISGWGIDTLHTTPAFFAELVNAGRPLPSLRQVHLGGEEVTGALVMAAAAVLDDDCRIHNGYGPTEATVNCAIQVVDRRAAGSGEAVPIGTASAENLLYVLSPDLETVPDGAEGELVVGGPGVALGYVGRPALTAEKFLPDPFAARPGARMYRTGDLVRRLPGGALAYAGRIDDQVKIRGHRVEPGEIGAVLSRCPGVSAVVVVATPAGPSQAARLLAYVVPARSAGPGDGDEEVAVRVRRYAADNLPGYMVPAHVVVVDRLPLTPNGKVDRPALPRPGAAGEDGFVTQDADAETHVYRQDDPAVALAAIWAEVLAVDLARVGPGANFFDIGGDSLAALRIAEGAQRAGLPVEPAHILLDQTVEAVMSRIRVAG